MVDTGSGTTELSIIIPARNAERMVGDQLRALAAQEWSGAWEIIVVDNGSTDSSARVVLEAAASDPHVRLQSAPNAVGASGARNAGAAVARGRSLAFCDADDEVQPGWIEAMGEALRRNDIVGGRLRLDGLNEPWLRQIFYSVPPESLDRFAGVVPFTASCNLGITRELYESLGGFDPLLGTCEGIDLCMRARANGAELVYVPDACVQYRYRDTMKGLWLQAVSYGRWSPEMSRRLTALGGPRPSPFGGLKNWVWLLRRLPMLRTRAGRARWVVVAGNRVGRVIGSVMCRHMYL